MQPNAHWHHFHHQADIGVCGEGETLEEAFANTALAMTAVITDPQLVSEVSGVPIRCRAPDTELLLVDFLNALVYEMATRHMIFSRFNLSITNDMLEGTAWGEPIDLERHRPAVEVKGASYTALQVREENGHWTAQCVVDV